MRRMIRPALVALLLTAVPVAAGAQGLAYRPPSVNAFARIEKGMPEQQVMASVGFPTRVGMYRPRLDRLLAVIGLGDAYRTYFYRGMGRVLFDGGSPFVQNGRVAKVEIDPGETGIAR
jgi:hypothetical protein